MRYWRAGLETGLEYLWQLCAEDLDSQVPGLIQEEMLPVEHGLE